MSTTPRDEPVVGELASLPIISWSFCFVVVALNDRRNGRWGVEQLWPYEHRWHISLILAASFAAAVMALTPVNLIGTSVSTVGASGSFSGSCGPTLAVATGGGAYGSMPSFPLDGPGSAALNAAQATVEGRCAAVAGRRATVGTALLAGAVGMALWAIAGPSRSRRRPRPTRARRSHSPSEGKTLPSGRPIWCAAGVYTTDASDDLGDDPRTRRRTGHDGSPRWNAPGASGGAPGTAGSREGALPSGR